VGIRSGNQEWESGVGISGNQKREKGLLGDQSESGVLCAAHVRSDTEN
jgi:hypothetical protein